MRVGLASDDAALVGGGLHGLDGVAAGAERGVGGGDDGGNANWIRDADGGAAESVGTNCAAGALGAVGRLAGGE